MLMRNFFVQKLILVIATRLTTLVVGDLHGKENGENN